jgi:hypothetical protein
LSAFSWSLVGWLAAFASKPAPTVGLSAFSWSLVGCQAAFASKLTPHRGMGCGQLETGRLAGRHRQQAGSYRKAKAEPTLFHHSTR